MKTLLLIFQLLAPATPHPCDLPPQTGEITVRAGYRFTFSWCHDSRDAAGKIVSITGWRLLRNTDVAIVVTPIVTATTNSAGLYGYSLSRFEPTRGLVSYGLTAMNGTAESPRARINMTVAP